MKVLIISECVKDQLKPSTLNTISAGLKLADHVDVLVASFPCTPIIEALKKIKGVKNILLAEDPVYEHPLAETLAPLIVDLKGDYTHILAPATTFGKNIMPRVSALLDVAQISDVIEIIDGKTFRRPIYAGNAIATVASKDPVLVLTIRTTAFEAAEKGLNQASILKTDIKISQQLSKFISEELHGGERPELPEASIVISGGRGLQTKENFSKLVSIADRMKAAIGASRAAVDAGLAPNDYQVGQTGQVVAPKLYIAVGISGASTFNVSVC